jgi:hypothetical protein
MERSDDLYKTFCDEKLSRLVDDARRDTGIVSRQKRLSQKLRSRQHRNKDVPFTRELESLCISHIVQNKNRRISDQDWRDLCHTLVPVAYCDFVLIDKFWRNFVMSTGLKPPNIAATYSAKEVRAFFSDLEAFELPESPQTEAELIFPSNSYNIIEKPKTLFSPKLRRHLGDILRGKK